jgi:hypothetical protein
MPASPPLANASLTNALQPLRLRYYDSPVPGWLRMLGGVLLSALPASTRRQLGASRRRLLLQVNGNELQLRALVDEQTTLVGMVRSTTRNCSRTCARAWTPAPPACRAGCCSMPRRCCARCWPCRPGPNLACGK